MNDKSCDIVACGCDPPETTKAECLISAASSTGHSTNDCLQPDFSKCILFGMALIQWAEKYQTGIEEIDAQHKQLVGCINELHDAIQAGSGQEALDAVLSKLTDYAESHFAFEEELLEDLGYVELAAHRGRHEEFIEVIEGMIEDLDHGKSNMGDMLMVFLRNWLLKHILIDDKYALSAPNQSLK